MSRIITKLWWWLGVHLFDTRCRCGGYWEEVGTSGWAMLRIHEECDTCKAGRTFLMEH